MYGALNRTALLIANALALLGGFALLIITVLNCVSIIGRAFVPLDIGIGPIKGIYDITEIGIAAAVFAFLPLCQLQRGHASVDILTALFSVSFNRFLDLLFDIGMLIIAIVGGWRLYLGMLDKYGYGETTLIAQIPVWQGYAASLIGATAFSIVSAFCVIRSALILVGRETKDMQNV